MVRDKVRFWKVLNSFNLDSLWFCYGTNAEHTLRDYYLSLNCRCFTWQLIQDKVGQTGFLLSNWWKRSCRGGSRGRVQGVRNPPPPSWDDQWLSNTTGILKKNPSVTPFLCGAPPPKKNPGSAPELTNLHFVYKLTLNIFNEAICIVFLCSLYKISCF